MTVDERPDAAPEPRDYTALKILALLCLAEVGILWLLINVESPVSPIVRRLLGNPIGVLTLVMCVVTLLCYVMAVTLAMRERRAKRRGLE